MSMKSFIFACLCSLALNSCITVPTGYGPHGTIEDLKLNTPVTKRHISFSVDFSSDLGPDAWFDKEEIILAIRENLTKSGLFEQINYTALNEGGEYHYHFKVAHTSHSYAERYKRGAIGVLSLMMIPALYDWELNWTMCYFVRGKEIFSASSQQAATDVLWLPAAVGTLFMNHLTISSSLKSKPMRYFIREIKNNKLNEIK